MTILLRLVAALAMRIRFITASVPELQNATLSVPVKEEISSAT